ncbi:MAG: DUF6788 family protein, partial [Pyrinomonadaceae bacterium]
LREIKKDLSALNLPELRQVEIWLRNHLSKAEDKIKTSESAAKNTIVEEIDINGKTYRLQFVRCGKETCKCATGGLHGPYWYAYWFENGKTKSKYLGKKYLRD